MTISDPVASSTSRRESGSPGMVVVDKDVGWTSHDVVARCRRIYSSRRVGHAGTLDPDATGVLLVGVGRFTRVLRYLSQLGKSYCGEVVLGTATTTLDASGEVTGTWDMSRVTIDDVREAAKELTGEIDQVPPMVSALKVGGQRLHELARRGVEVERAPRRVRVDRFDVEPGPAPGIVRIEVDCSSGTYVRSLAAELGEKLGGGAHLRNLRRTRVGSFEAKEARKVQELSPEHLLSPAEAVRDLEAVSVDRSVVKAVSHGLALDKVALGARGPGPWALLDEDGHLLAIYEATRTDRIVAGVVLAAAGAEQIDHRGADPVTR